MKKQSMDPQAQAYFDSLPQVLKAHKELHIHLPGSHLSGWEYLVRGSEFHVKLITIHRCE